MPRRSIELTSEACSLLEEHVPPPETQREEEEVIPGCVCSDLGRLAKRPSAIILNSGKQTKAEMEVGLLLLTGKSRAAPANSYLIRMSCKDNSEEADTIGSERCQPR